jgi:hypothetical protein
VVTGYASNTSTIVQILWYADNVDWATTLRTANATRTVGLKAWVSFPVSKWQKFKIYADQWVWTVFTWYIMYKF